MSSGVEEPAGALVPCSRGDRAGRVGGGGRSGRSVGRLVLATTAIAGLAGACADLAFSPPTSPASLGVTPADTLLTVGDTVRFSVTVFDEAGRPMPHPPTWIQAAWSADDSAAVRFLDDGRAVALKAADTKITAEVAGLVGRTPLRSNPRQARLSAPVHYVTQGIQDSANAVPLVAGKEALVRVFAVADQEAYFDLEVRATFTRPGGLELAVPMRSMARVVPTSVDQGSLDLSFNGLVPGVMIVPGTTMVIELDPDRTIELSPGSTPRIPETGELELDVRPVPPLDLTVVPVVSVLDPDAAIVEATRGLGPDSEALRLARSILPVSDIDVSVRQPYQTSVDLTTGPGWVRLLEELTLLYKTERLRGYYYGALSPSPAAARTGIGYVAIESIAAGLLNGQVIAHELGHNMSLKHAPCGGAAAPDRHFPYEDGAIGVWGYDFHSQRIVFPALHKDVMGYCTPVWGSDYHFKRALAFRLESEAAGAGLPSRTMPTLLLWGNTGLGPDAEPRIEPVFAADAYPSLPDQPGPYRLDGLGEAGQRLFTFSFGAAEDEFGGAPFAFAVPVDSAWDGALAEVVLSGPDGNFRLGRGGATPAALVRDPATGHVRAILRDWSGAPPGWTNLLPDELDIVVSDGVPAPAVPR